MSRKEHANQAELFFFLNNTLIQLDSISDSIQVADGVVIWVTISFPHKPELPMRSDYNHISLHHQKAEFGIRKCLDRLLQICSCVTLEKLNIIDPNCPQLLLSIHREQGIALLPKPE